MKYKNHYTQQVYDIMMPLVGDFMTQNILKLQSQKIGKTVDTLTVDDIPKIAGLIKSGITIFIGSDAANTINQKILSIH